MWGSMLSVWGVGFRVQGSGFRVQGAGLRVTRGCGCEDVRAVGREAGTQVETLSTWPWTINLEP